MLNFGHTLGHAVEALSGYRLLHGEAVAIGMVLEARLGEAMGVTETGTADRITEVLSAAGLPTRLPERMSAAAVLAATRTDKKARRGRVEYALIERIGAASAGAEGTWVGAGEEGVVEGVLNFESNGPSPASVIPRGP
jgi:3-dehydroquinate synthetase